MLSYDTYSWRLAIVDCVDEPKIVDDSIFEEALGVMEDNVNLCLLHWRDNACKQKLQAYMQRIFIKSKLTFSRFCLCPSIILHHYQVSIKLFCDTEMVKVRNC